MAPRRYVDRLTDPIGPPPSCFDDVQAFFFELKACHDVLENICRTHLNDPLQSSHRTFKLLSDTVVLAFSHFPRAYSRYHKGFGSVEYTEVALMLSVLVEGGGKSESAYYVPALFLDGPPVRAPQGLNPPESIGAPIYPITTGREMYGLPKTRAKITWDPSNNDKWASVHVFNAVQAGDGDPPPELGLARLITVKASVPSAKGTSATGAGAHGRPLAPGELQERVARLHGVRPDEIKPDDGGMTGRIEALKVRVDLRHPYIGGRRVLGLKQFRDAKDFSRTESQHVVAAPYSVVGDLLPLMLDFHIEITDAEHVKLAKYLGLQTEYCIKIGAEKGGTYEGVNAEFGDPSKTDVW